MRLMWQKILKFDYREMIKHLYFDRCLIFWLLDITLAATINLVDCENQSIRTTILFNLALDKSTTGRALYDNHGGLPNSTLKHGPCIFRLVIYSQAVT